MKLPTIEVKQIILGIVGVLIIFPVIGFLEYCWSWECWGGNKAWAVNRVANPGFVFKIPLIEYVNQMETRTQKEQADASSASKDLQEVKATIALNYHLRGEKSSRSLSEYWY